MANQKNTRPDKRHLVRWNDDMDKKLLLALQSICNDKNLKLPWDEVGDSMDEKVSGGAIIQHLAKIRQRLAAQGMKVPPPLRRGGGNVTSPSAGRKIAKGKSAGLKKAKSRANSQSENGESEIKEDDTEFDGGASDFEGGIDSGPPKNVKHATTANGREAGPKGVDNVEKEQQDEDVPSKAGDKRKRGKKICEPLKRNSRPTISKIQKRKGTTGKRYAQPSVTSTNTYEESPNEDETRTGSDEDELPDPVGRRYLAAGASFLDDYDEALQSRENNGQGPKATSRIEVLRFGKSERAKALLQGLEDQEQATNEADTESVASSDPISIARLDGGGKSTLPGDEACPKIEEMNTHSVASGNAPQHSQGYAEQHSWAPISYEKSGKFYTTSGENSVGLGGNNVHNERNRAYGAPDIYHPAFRAASHQYGNSMSTDLGSMHFEGPAGYSAHISQQTSVTGFAPSNPHPYGVNFPDHYANRLVPGASWSLPQAFDQTGSQMPQRSVSGRTQGHGGRKHYVRDPYGMERQHRDNLVPVSNQNQVRPTGLGQTFVDLTLPGPRPDLLGYSIAEGQDFLSGIPENKHQQIGTRPATNGTPSAITATETFSPGNSSLPDISDVHRPKAENSDEVIWSDFLVDFEDSDEA